MKVFSARGREARQGRAAPKVLNDSARAKRDEVCSSVTGARARVREGAKRGKAARRRRR